MKKWMIFGVVILVLLGIGLFLYFTLTPPSEPKTGSEIINPIEGMSQSEAVLQFNESQIDYLVFAIGGWKLHNPPLSSETPKIKVIVNGDVFISEIKDGQIKTEKKDIDNEDIILRTTKEEIVNSILSPDMVGYIRESMEQGITTFEFKASYTTLFLKGYLPLYEDATGESLTGSVIRSFRS